MRANTLAQAAAQPRYYYTDALAAAWMAKHFGMKFYHPDGDEFAPVGTSDAVDLFINAEHGQRLYIHHDSLALLEPQSGDIALNCDGDATRLCDDDDTPFQGWTRISTAREFIGTAAEIIHRNELAFFWPEVEA